ncbi:MAG TPA: cytidylate kinase-like family protein [Acidimicrobiales bacterium]|nr:cytidylate kinase-like family protein [Acidimicrobiales bacterium]
MSGTIYEPVVTVSATYGAGGSAIAPRLAEALGVPFIDRLITADFSQDVARREAKSKEGLCEEEREVAPAGRFLSYFARAASVGAMMAPEPIIDDEETIRATAEEALKGVAAGQPAVILGRAAAVALKERPRTYHVRLDGPVERRVAWAARFEHLDLEAARQRQAETEKARTLFVKRLYRVDPSDPRLYHLILDSTVLDVEASVEVIMLAARKFLEGHAD